MVWDPNKVYPIDNLDKVCKCKQDGSTLYLYDDTGMCIKTVQMKSQEDIENDKIAPSVEFAKGMDWPLLGTFFPFMVIGLFACFCQLPVNSWWQIFVIAILGAVFSPFLFIIIGVWFLYCKQIYKRYEGKEVFFVQQAFFAVLFSLMCIAVIAIFCYCQPQML